MSSLKLFVFDLKNGIATYWYRYVLIFFFFILAALASQNDSLRQGLPLEDLTFGDYLFGTFYGMQEYHRDSLMPFSVPALWISLFLLVFYAVLDYPYQDILGAGQRFIVQSQSRTTWWLTKCLWVIVSIVLVYIISFLALLFITFISGGAFDFSFSANVLTMKGFAKDYVFELGNLFSFLFLCFVMTVSLGLLQLFLSLILKPAISFIFMIIILFFSAYYQFSFLPGNYLMAARSGAFFSSGLDMFGGIILAVGIGVAATLCGGMYMKRMDIIEKESLHD